MSETPELSENNKEPESKDLSVTLSKDATFADLFDAIDAIEEKEGLGELHFEEELWDNFSPEIVEEVLSFRETQTSETAATKVIDFFKKRGYNQKEISIFLPIKFKHERKNK